MQLSPIETGILQGEVIEALRTVYDPEIPVNIYDLGLIYEVNVTPEAAVTIRMTLTSPGCPVAGSLPPEVREKTASVAGVTEATVDLVWEPPWNMDMMSDEAKLELGMY
jgi:FeS assembly SUF system protein